MRDRNFFFPVILSLLFISCNRSDTMFTSLSSSETNIQFANNLEKRNGFGILYYLYYYNGGGVATGDINNDGLTDIYFTANSHGNNKLYINKGNFKFEDVTAKANVAGQSDWCTGVTMTDVNADGWLDIYVCAVQGEYGLKGRNELFINNRKGGFTESAAQYGLDLAAFSCQAAFFDYDRDGDLDCYIINQSHHPNQNITDTSGRRKYNPYSGDRLFRNDIAITGKFTDVTAAAGIYQSSLGYGLGLAIADLNNDGWEDIYVGNDFHENDYYYVNTGKGTFIDGSYKYFNHFSRFSMGNDIADYDNDGQADVLTVDMLPPDESVLKNYGSDESPDVYNQKIAGNGYQYQYSRNCLQHNNGDGQGFSDVALAAGVAATDWSWSALMNDFDNDGNKDIFISSGIVKRPMDLDYIKFVSNLSIRQAKSHSGELDEIALEKSPDGASYCYLFKGDGQGGFSEKGREWGITDKKGYFNGTSYADLDNDGDLDLVVNALNGPAVVYRNNTAKQNYLQFQFEGDSMNKFGIGVKVYLLGNKKLQYQQLELTRGFQSSVEPRLTFGLGNDVRIDSALVVWPDQRYVLYTNVKANERMIVKKSEARQLFGRTTFFPDKKQLFEDVSAQVANEWTHRENPFTDFNSQYLIPHKQSTRGPGLATGDVNKDGLDDIFVCGANGQPGCLLLQTKQGKFIESDSAVFNKTKSSEGVSAVFFDADKDGSIDLYVASGGNEYPDGSPELGDHLYMNDGRGHFKEADNALPKLYFNKSVVTVADIDKDGDIDVFVGGLADAEKYGLPQSSYLLINDGNGNFKIAGENIIQLKNTGITTTASFTDINKDTWPDLIITGEWMPLKIYMNDKGVFDEKDITKSTGLWQAIYPADVNGDGNMDILAGNWGHNSKLWSGKDGPLKLYIKDFDRNGSTEQIMCYTVNGKEYTFLAKDELEKALPVLKKGYLTYNEVAGKTVQYMFDDLFAGYTQLEAETLSSSCFIGDGKGGFERKDLPEELQLAPVFVFTALAGKNTFLGAGNFYGVLPYEGRYDALAPTVFYYTDYHTSFRASERYPLINGEARNARWINGTGNNKILVIAGNNEKLTFLKMNNQ